MNPKLCESNPNPYFLDSKSEILNPEPCTTRPAPLSFREIDDLEANQTGSLTHAVGRKGETGFHPSDRLQNAPAGRKDKQSFYTKVQTGTSGEKYRQRFDTKETAPPNPYSLEKTGARVAVE